MLDATPQSCFLLSPVLDQRRRGALKTDGARCTRAGSPSSDPAAARNGARSRSPAPSILALTPLAVPTHGHAHQRRRSLLSPPSPSRRTVTLTSAVDPCSQPSRRPDALPSSMPKSP